ncbi:c-type cytochrome [Undibacterium sp. RuRC25W]|uniref:c-type cytochrome n=1 Tax=Undibacterium sp. RuRC25W TaxID=3413047 RepID=UPI003BF02858
MKKWVFCLFYFIFLSQLPVNAQGNALNGESIYNSRCFACHSLDANRVGPAHRGVFGRKVGSIADYVYSAALKHSTLVWNEKNLDLWLKNPEALIPGQAMGYSVTEQQDRDDVIAYLKNIKKTK